MSIDPRIFQARRGESDSAHHKRIWAELRKFNAYNASELIFQIAANKNMPSVFFPIYGEFREHYDMLPVAAEFATGNFIAWTLGSFTANVQLINQFVESRSFINSAILKGDSAGALKALETLNKKCKSWWAVLLEIHIAKELEHRDTRQLIQDLPARFSRGNIKNRILDLQLIAESSSIYTFVRELLGRMNEYRSSGLQDAIDNGAAESCRYLPASFDMAREVKIGTLENDWYESLIDQYIMFKEIVCELEVTDKLPGPIRNTIVQLSQDIHDPELRAIFGEEQPLSMGVAKVLDSYTRGHYSETVVEINKLVSEGTDDALGLLEILAKAKIYAGELTPPQTFFELIANELAAILQCDKKSSEKIDYLRRICIKFRNEAWAKSLNFHLLSALEAVETPREIETARLHARCLGGFNTPKARMQNYRVALPDNLLADIPLYRQMKYAADGGSGLHIEKAMFPVLSDFLKLKANTLILQEDFVGAIIFAVSEYLANSVSCIHLPIRALCRLAGDLPKVDNETFIACLILYDIYFREYSGTFEEDKSALFEEFMSSNGSHRPSLVFAKFQFTEMETYFLKYLCIPSQLDNLISYVSNDDVIHERVSILDILISAKVSGYEQLRYEKDSVLETMFSEKLRAKLESGKLFVDIQALKAHRKHIYYSLYEQAKTTSGGIQLEPLSRNDNASVSADIFEIVEGSALASNRKTELLYQIFDAAVQDFALDENYGLDKYLSAEIRHVVFVTQLRSCFEKTNLVTSQKEGVYLSNKFWVDKYYYVNASLVSRIDALLMSFSEQVDLILAEVNERFRVERFERESASVFDFLAYHYRLVRVSECVVRADNAEQFLDKLLEYLWELASDSARTAQELINDQLSVVVLCALDELEAEINHVKGDVSVIELMQHIKNARSLFTQEIELVLNWFRFVGADDSKNLERLSVVIEATISSFDSIYGHKYRKPTVPPCKLDLHLNYREARALFISLFTALENACKYGGSSEPVSVVFEAYAEKSYINIINTFSPESSQAAEFLVSQEKRKWSPEYSLLGRAEGGSGLYKIYSTLSTSSPGYDFDIEASQTYFKAKIGLIHENFDHRRQLAKARENS